MRGSLLVVLIAAVACGNHAPYDGDANKDALTAGDSSSQDDGDATTSSQDASVDAPPPPSGTLDPGFGSGGVAVVASTAKEHGIDLAVQPDGKIVVVGDTPAGMLVLRFLDNGTLDSSFGTAGRVVVGGASASALGVTLQSDGKIVVAGHDPGYSLAVARLLSNGALDTSFGTAGIARPFASGAFGNTFSAANDVAVRSDGRVVVCGLKNSAPSTGAGLVARLTAAGALDATFGTNGFTTVTLTNKGGGFNRLALDGANRIAVAGIAHYDYSSGNGHEWWLARFTSDGTLDASYKGGQFSGPFGPYASAQDISIQLDGDIVTAGSYYSDPTTRTGLTLFRTGSDGNADHTLGTSGWVIAGSPGVINSDAYALALQADGKVLAAGDGYDSSSRFPVMIVRRLSDGTADPTFAESGSLAFYIDTRNAQVKAMAVANAIYVVGWVRTSDNLDDDLFLAHVN